MWTADGAISQPAVPFFTDRGARWIYCASILIVPTAASTNDWSPGSRISAPAAVHEVGLDVSPGSQRSTITSGWVGKKGPFGQALRPPSR